MPKRSKHNKKLLAIAAVVCYLGSGTGYALANEIAENSDYIAKAADEKSNHTDEKTAKNSDHTTEDTDKNTQEGDVIVTATRTEQEVKDVPYSVQIITKEEIEAKEAKTLRQALTGAVSFTPTVTQRSQSTISIRGAESRHVLVLIDGKRLLSEQGLAMGNAYDIDRIGMENVERIEIVRGPSSSLYGSDALGGVINIITKVPGKESLRLNYEIGSYAGRSGDGFDNWSVFYDSPKIGKFAFSFNYGKSSIDPHEIPSDLMTKKEYLVTDNYYGDRTPWGFKGTFDVGKTGKIIFSYDELKEDISMDDTSQGSSTWDPATRHHVNKRQTYSIGYDKRNGDTNYQVRFYQTKYDKDSETRRRDVQSTVNPGHGRLSDFDFLNREINVFEGNVNTSWRENHLLTFGAEYRKEKIYGSRIATGQNTTAIERELVGNPNYSTAIGFSPGGNPQRYASGADIDSTAFYLQDEWVVNDKLLVIPSFRFDASNKFENSFNPKLGATYKINPNNRLKFSIGTAFKAPGMLELYSQTYYAIGVGWFIGNSNLKPEKSNSMELSYEHDHKKFTSRISIFRDKVTDLISTQRLLTRAEAQGMSSADLEALTGVANIPPVSNTFTALPYISTYKNIDKATIQGVETVFGYKFNNNISASLNYLYLDATDDNTGEKLPRRPKNQIGLNLLWRDKASGWSGNLNGTWMNDYHDNYNDIKPILAYGLWNIMFNKELNEKSTFYIGADNIFNFRDYHNFITGTIYRVGINFKM